MYKAIVVREFGPPSVLHVGSLPIPSLKENEVLVDIKAVGVNPVETYVRSGTYPRLPALPWTPGQDSGGTVAAVGSKVTKWKPGDRVCTISTSTGTYAEKTVANENHLLKLPENLSFEQGAAVGIPYATAYHSLFQKCRGQKGETVFVHGGSGGVGIAAIQLAAAAGFTVIASAGTKEGEALCKENGAHHVLNHRQEGYLGEISKITDGKGVDIVLEMAAHINLGKDLPLLAKFGRVAIIGSRGPVEINPRDLMGREANVVGIALAAAPPAEMIETYIALQKGLLDGSIRPVAGKRYPLEEAPKAHDEIINGTALGKMILLP